MNATPMQGRAGYEWATKQIATQQCQVLPWKYAFRHFSQNVESIPPDPCSSPVPITESS